jgi:hypothetical protein
MKKSHFTAVILIALFILTVNIEIYPKLNASIPPIPDQFIADIFPKNNNTNIQLLNTNATITLNATDLINEIGIIFNGTYILFNPENPTNITINLPFSLCFDVENATFGVSVNDTQVPFEIVSTAGDNLTSMGVNIDFIPAFDFHCPITLITSNLTLLENKTYVVKYQFEGSIPKPLSFRNLFYMIYSSDTARLWKGNATERVELKVFGGNPIFGITGNQEGLPQMLDIAGGKMYICEWNNAQNYTVQIGITFYGSTPEFIPIELIVLNILGYVTITSVIILWIIWRKRKRS